MRIEIDIPDPPEPRHYYIFSGGIVVARMLYGKEWEIKTGDCSQCGKCCGQMGRWGDYLFGSDENGDCNQLVDMPGPGNKKDCELMLKGFRPFGCGIADANINTCTLKWEQA